MNRLSRRIVLVALLAGVALPVALFAQGRGRGAGGGGGSASAPERLDLFVSSFTLTDDQKKEIKKVMDAEFKAAAPLREQLSKARLAAGMAIQTGKPQSDIDAAAAAYGKEAAAMAAAEMKALAKVNGILTAAQKGNAAAMQGAVYMMRGALAGKKWDAVPDVRFY